MQRRFAQRDQEDLQQLQQEGIFISGAPVQRFENDFAAYCGVDHCIGTGNGLDALTIILRAEASLNRLPKQAKILVPAHTYIATFLSIIQAGMQPVPVDVTAVTLTVADIQPHLQNIDAIVAVDIYGKLVDDEVYAFAKANSIPIYTDAAQSHGAVTTAGEKSGSRGDASAFSFYPTKNLGAMGDAGAITCRDAQLAATCRQIADYGRQSRFINVLQGINSRLDTLQAAFLSNRLLFLDNDNKKRHKIAVTYSKQIENTVVTTFPADFYRNNAVHVYSVYVEDRDRFVKHLENRGIQTSCHYKTPPHHQPALATYKWPAFPQTEYLHRTQVSLPCHPLLEDHEVQEIIIAINQYV